MDRGLKEVWLIPKRINVHQSICLIDGIIERNYDGTSWNPSKQNNLGVNLKNWGATNDGKNISNQSIRTLVASIPQYLGFLYLDNRTTPVTINLTSAGYMFHKYHKKDLKVIKNLRQGKESLIEESIIILKQMEKLQLTNPIELKYCEKILLFPFRITLELLKKLEYLDRDEIGYFLLRMRDRSEVDLVINEITNFRCLTREKRKNIIESYKKTSIGNITLVQAPAAVYYQSLCVTTGLVEKKSIVPSNLQEKISSINIKKEKKNVVDEILEKYDEIMPYDFKENLTLWIDYIGNIEREYPPIDISVINNTNEDIFILIENENLTQARSFYSIKAGSTEYIPFFMNEKYIISTIISSTGKVNQRDDIVFGKEHTPIYTINKEKNKIPKKPIKYSDKIIEHSQSSGYTKDTNLRLEIIKEYTGIDKKSPHLRGSFYEYYFYKYLEELQEKNIIDDVFWNGSIGEYGLPIAAPGGKVGTADIIFRIDDIDFVLELTTIKSKSAQESAELASVPDHIRVYAEKTTNKVIGIFCAPIIHERTSLVMFKSLAHYNISFFSISDRNLIDILEKGSKQEVKKILLNISSSSV